MASVFGQGRSKSASKSKDHKEKDHKEKDHKEKDLCKRYVEETQFIEHGAGKKTGKGKHVKETGGQGEIESSSSLEASGGDQKKKERKERFGRSKDKKKPTSQAATSPSKIPFPATTPTSPDDLSLRTSTELYQSPEKQRDQQQKLAETPLGAGISARIPSTTSCDSQASGSLVSPNSLSLDESSARFRELEAKLQRSEEMRLEEMQHIKQEHEKALAELEEKHAAALEEKVKELEKKENDFKAMLSQKEQELVQKKNEEVAALQQQQQRQEQKWQAALEERESEYKSRLSVREQELFQEMQTKAEEFRASRHQQQQKWQTQLEEKSKAEENAQKIEQEIQRREEMLRQELQQKDGMAKLKEDIEMLRKENSELKGELEAQRVQATVAQHKAEVMELQSALSDAKRQADEISNEKQKVEEQRDHLQLEVEQLRGDLAVLHNEGTKEERKQKEEAIALRLQLEAERSETDRLQHQLEQTEATVRELELKLNTSEATVAQQKAEVMELQTALSDAETSRRDISQKLTEVNEKLAKVKEDYRLLDQKYLAVLAVKDNLQSEISHIECIQNEVSQVKQEALRWKNELTTKNAELTQLKGSAEEMAKLKEDIETLRKENAELQGDLEAQRVQAAIWKQDFDRERHEREQAAGRRDDEQAREYIHTQQLQIELNRARAENLRLQSELKLNETSYKELTTNLAEVQHELVKHKDQVADMEQIVDSLVAQLKKANQELQECKAQLEQANKLHRNQLDDLHRQVRHANQQLDEAITNNEKLIDDVLAKTQQVKQYKKQVDGLKTELAKYRSQDKEKLMQQLANEDQLLQAARDEQLQLRQQAREKDRVIQSLLGEKQALTQQTFLSKHVQQAPSQQAQQTQQSEFWEVPRMEVSLNMQKIIGTGAWGFVVEGTFRGQLVAVKSLHDMIRSPKVVEIMRKEIAIMAQVRHPNLVLLIAAVIDTENDPLIVTELLDISLRKAYEKKRLQGSSKLSIFRDIAAALNYLHLHQSGEIIHRDVSSGNVLLEAKPNNQWKAKLSDFGSAKLAIEAKTKGPGAPIYSAPEILKEMGICHTAKVDIYSYGILLCEVTEEQFPDEESLPSMIQAVQGKWAFMHRLITSCVQDHPDNRPTMSYVLGEFNKLRPQN